MAREKSVCKYADMPRMAEPGTYSWHSRAMLWVVFCRDHPGLDRAPAQGRQAATVTGELHAADGRPELVVNAVRDEELMLGRSRLVLAHAGQQSGARGLCAAHCCGVADGSEESQKRCAALSSQLICGKLTSRPQEIDTGARGRAAAVQFCGATEEPRLADRVG